MGEPDSSHYSPWLESQLFLCIKTKTKPFKDFCENGTVSKHSFLIETWAFQYGKVLGVQGALSLSHQKRSECFGPKKNLPDGNVIEKECLHTFFWLEQESIWRQNFIWSKNVPTSSTGFGVITEEVTGLQDTVDIKREKG